MKINVVSIITGAINGCFLSIAPLLFYEFVLLNSSVNTALSYALGMLFLIFIGNLIILTRIYGTKAKMTQKKYVFPYVFLSWIVGIMVLMLFLSALGVFDITGEENLETFISVLCVIFNFIIIIIATIIAKIVGMRFSNQNLN